ncbi:hypothetical protein DFH08DRAFT_758750 [Mycena albidolilacea]|uniref:RRM Nup35-type domain-containing protein n=1 Tax=Mycena albidolilacea TaxID=1033008 RepID=A0AAD6Z2B8_9AGAR|nr:hypothetical protein DFH08DRAFT_758750 [Mycena albidolilacea]
MAPSPFAVAGMASTSTSHLNHNPNLNTWGGASTSGSLSNSFTDTLSQSRSHYQPGYLMSASQANNSPTGAQRVDEAPVVQTKAKMNNAFSRGPSSDFGMDSMFQSTRQRQTLADEDAPPMSSVNDIPTEMYAAADSSNSFQPRASAFTSPSKSAFGRRPPPPSSSSTQAQQPMLYIIVFGYPPDKYSLTAEYFQSLTGGGSASVSDPDPHAEIVNCFRIGYRDPADAMRAVRKNGEVLGGSWMVGAKWADPAQAEALLNQPLVARHTSPDPMAVDSPSPSASLNPNNSNSGFGLGATVGTPIKLAPSASAFRRGGASPSKPPAAQAQQAPSAQGWGAAVAPATPVAPAEKAGKGVIGQVSDMIFGW